jgi:hypothetical protein
VRRFAIAALLVVGCSRQGDSSRKELSMPEAGRGPGPGAETMTPTTTTTTTTTLKWQERALPDGVVMPMVDGAALVDGEAGGVRYAMQDLADPAIRLGIWSGAGQDLAGFRGRFGPPRRFTAGREEAITLCGGSVPATRQVLAVEAAPDAVGSFPAKDGSIGHKTARFPALHAVGVAFSWKGTGYLAAWTVPGGDRDRVAADEAHFFASIRCAP